MNETPRPGSIAWQDLTVPDAEAVRDFYHAVVGWEAEPVDMGDYDDFAMTPPDGEQPVAGICHARGVNADLPPVWLVYIVVEDVEAAARRCEERGGEVLRAPGGPGAPGMAVIRDPAGAICALYQA